MTTSRVDDAHRNYRVSTNLQII